MTILQIASDTLIVKSINVNGSSTSTWSPQLITAVVASISAVIGSLITIFLKSTEFKFQRIELENQRKLINETISNNEDKLKAELIRIKQIKTEYELSLKKHNYDKFKQVLEFAESHSKENHKDKIGAIKNYNEFLSVLDKDKPADDFFDDIDDYKKWVSKSTFKNLNLISKFLSSFNSRNIHVYPELSDRIVFLQKKADNLSYQISDQKANYEGNDQDDSVIFSFSEKLIELKSDLENVLEEMKLEFKELEKIKKDFIKSQFPTE